MLGVVALLGVAPGVVSSGAVVPLAVCSVYLVRLLAILRVVAGWFGVFNLRAFEIEVV